MVFRTLFTVQDNLRVVPIYLALIFKRYLPFIRNPMAALPEQVGFLVNQSEVSSPFFLEMAINETAHVGILRCLNLGNARLARVIWRKVKNQAQHEFIVMYVRENRSEQPRTSVVVAHRFPDPEAHIRDNASTNNDHLTYRDRLWLGHNGTDAFVRARYPITDTIIDVDFERFGLNLLHVISLAAAIHQLYPHDNCNSFSNLLFQGLLSVVDRQHPGNVEILVQQARDSRQLSRSVVEGKWQGIISAREDLTKRQTWHALMEAYDNKILAATKAAQEALLMKLNDEIARRKAQKDMEIVQKDIEIARLRLQLAEQNASDC